MTDKPDTPRPVRVSKAPPPIIPIRVGRYTAPNAPPVPPPNWDKWGHMRDVELWEAVALSLNLEPDKLPVYLGAFERFGDDPFRICPQTFLDRLQVANSNCGISLGFRPVHKLKARCLVDLPAFGAWVVKLNIPNIPPALAAMAATATAVPVVMPAQNTTTPAPLLKREARRGYVLALTDGQAHVQFGELAHLIADALWPDAGADDARVTYGCTRVNLDAELVRAVKFGTLHVKDPLTFGPHAFPVGNALLSALVTVDDVREFVAGRGLTVETARTQATTLSPAPVMPAGASDGLPDPERRLTRLRELGGNAKYSRCVWKFVGIGKLVESEKSEGRNRNDEKTIRADLREAAQAENDAKRAGFGSGLGHR